MKNEIIEKIQELLSDKSFLKTIKQEDEQLYISLQLITEMSPELAEEIYKRPKQTLDKIKEDLEEKYLLKGNLRLTDIPKSFQMLIRENRSKHINKLVAFEGVIRQAGKVLTRVVSRELECPKCGTTFSTVELGDELKNLKCSSCGKYPRVVSEETTDNQTLVMEESADLLDAVKQPERIHVIIEDGLVAPKLENRATPGTRILAVGILKDIELKKNSSKRTRVLDAINIIPLEEEMDVNITPEIEEQIIEASKDPKLFQKFIDSFASSIIGHEDIKRAILLQLAGGSRTKKSDGSWTREFLHLLLIGSRSTGKSVLLNAAHKLLPRARKANGAGTTGAGLCVHGDTLIETNGEILTAKEYCERYFLNKDVDKITSIQVENQTTSGNKLTHVWKIPNTKELSFIETENKKRIIMTSHTPIMTKDGWKDSGKVVIGDKLLWDNVCIKDNRDEISFYNILKKTNIRITEGKKEILSRLNKYIQEDKEALCMKLGMSKQKIWNWNHGLTMKTSDLMKFCDYYNIQLEDLIPPSLEILGYSSYKSRRTLPLRMNKDIAYLLGVVHGDGNVCFRKDQNSGYVNITTMDLIQEIERISKEQFNIKISNSKTKDNRAQTIRINDKTIATLFSETLGKKEKIPHILYRNHKFLNEYIAGLFDTDGSVYKKEEGIVIEFSQSNERLVRELQSYLFTKGVKSVVRERKGNGKVSIRKDGHRIITKRDYFILSVHDIESQIKFREIIKLRINRKKENIKCIKNTLSKQRKYLSVINVGKVQSPSYVYDVTVDKIHKFQANELTVHNTAGVVKDENTGQFMIEAGAIPLAHNSLLCLDECDKTGPNVREHLHECMESGTISISKVGNQQILNAHTSILAAANPKTSEFNINEDIVHQINMPVSLLSRFDGIFIVKDEANESKDELIADKILSEHGGDTEKAELSQEFMKQYITYARKLNPIINKEAQEMIKRFYLDLRKAGKGRNIIQMATRQLEGIVRLAQAHAKYRLSKIASKQDAEVAIEVMKSWLRQMGVDEETGLFNANKLTEPPRSKQKKFNYILGLFEKADKKKMYCHEIESLTDETMLPKDEIWDILKSMKVHGYFFEPSRGLFQLIV